MSYIIRIATLADRESLEKWANSPTAPKIAKEFPFIWRRNQSWESSLNLPSIAVHVEPPFENQIIGFHATTYTKMGYANLYYVAVDNGFKGQRIGKRLIEDAIKRAKLYGMKRWTNKSHHNPKNAEDDNGENFFSNHLGIKPVGLQSGQVVYDWSLQGIDSCTDIQSYSGDLLRVDEIPERKKKQYARYWDEILIPIPGLVLKPKE